MEWLGELYNALVQASFGASRVGDTTTYNAIVKLLKLLDKRYRGRAR